MTHATPRFTPGLGDELTHRTFTTFFDVLQVLLRAGVTTVAEAAFQDRVWRPRLEELADLADIRIVECRVATEIARARQQARDASSEIRKATHVPDWYPADFAWISLPLPILRVDTTDGYTPQLEKIAAFAGGGCS